MREEMDVGITTSDPPHVSQGKKKNSSAFTSESISQQTIHHGEDPVGEKER